MDPSAAVQRAVVAMERAEHISEDGGSSDHIVAWTKIAHGWCHIAEAIDVVDDVLLPIEVVREAVEWAREAGGPAYDENDEWCAPMAALASYLS